MKFHKDGTLPTNGEMFVFGSNLRGIHGAGAALAAHKHLGAETGKGHGVTGQCYALPTKDHQIRSLTLDEIERNVELFCLYTHTHPDTQFYVSRVACVLAGYRDCDIAPMFRAANTENCSFAEEWRQFLE